MKMTTRGDHAEDEVKRLRRCIDDLVSLLALPPVSIDGDPSGVASTIARQLNERVVQRTRELAAVNEELKHEIAKHRRQEVALRDSEASSRLIVDSIPGLVALFTPAGEVEFVNRQIVEYFGGTFEELKHWETGGTNSS